jgi:RNA polymerase primary sigma factor
MKWYTMTTQCLSRSRSAQAPLETYFRDINDTPLLSAEEERELAFRIGEGDPEARDHLVRANLRLVVNIARRYIKTGMDLADLIAEGNLGLLRAVEAFDASMNTRFSTYASFWIKQSIKRAIVYTGKPIRIPAYMNELLVKWRRTSSQLEDVLGRPPTEEEVAQELNLRPKKLRIIKEALAIFNSMPVTGSALGKRPLEESHLDPRNCTPDTFLVHSEDLHQILGLLEKLDEREAMVLRMRFGLDGEDPCTLEEIGNRLGLTRERVRQIERFALGKLAERLQEV